jgi:cytochrome P450
MTEQSSQMQAHCLLNEQYLADHSLLPLITGTGHDDPYPVYDYLRAHHPVYRDKRGTWLISTHKAIKQIFENRDDAFFSPPYPGYEAWLNDSIVFQDGDGHTRLRRLIAPLFSADALAQLGKFIDAEVQDLVAPLRRMPRFNVSTVALELSVVTVCRLLGLPRKDAMAYFMAAPVAETLRARSLGVVDKNILKLESSAERFLGMMQAQIQASGPDSEGAIGHFLRLEQAGEFTRRETVANLMMLFILGYITTALSIGNVVEAALRDRHIWESWRADPAAISASTAELMRYDSPSHAIVRFAKRDVEFEGQQIRQGDRILLLLASANRDTEEFSAPDRIDLSRTEGRHATFGMGARACIGRMLSKLEIDAFVKALVAAVPEATLDSDASKRTQLILVHGYPSLWLANPAAARP